MPELPMDAWQLITTLCHLEQTQLLERTDYDPGPQPDSCKLAESPIDCCQCHLMDRCWRLRPNVRVGVVIEEGE